MVEPVSSVRVSSPEPNWIAVPPVPVIVPAFVNDNPPVIPGLLASNGDDSRSVCALASTPVTPTMLPPDRTVRVEAAGAESRTPIAWVASIEPVPVTVRFTAAAVETSATPWLRLPVVGGSVKLTVRLTLPAPL